MQQFFDNVAWVLIVAICLFAFVMVTTPVWAYVTHDQIVMFLWSIVGVSWS